MSETALLLSRKAADVLAERGIEQPRLDAELILAHVLGVSRLQLYLQYDRPLTDDELVLFRSLIRRRLKHEPVQYLTGTAHFRHLELAVDPRVLIPRPETEELVGHVLEWAWAEVGGKPGRIRASFEDDDPAQTADAATRGHGDTVSGGAGYPGEADGAAGQGATETSADADVPPRVAASVQGGEADAVSATRRLTALDLCTGSGSIALSLLKEGPFARVVATDLSAEALGVARENAQRLGLETALELRQGALWDAVGPDERFDVVVSNPPYVGEEERPALAPEVAEWEPAGALFAGPGGFAVLDPLIAGAAAHLEEGGLLALEIGAAQGQGVLERLEAHGSFEQARVLPDMAGRDRVALARRSLARDEKRGDHA